MNQDIKIQDKLKIKDEIRNDLATYIFNKFKMKLLTKVITGKISKQKYKELLESIEKTEEFWVKKNCKKEYYDKLVLKKKFNIGKQHPQEFCKPNLIRKDEEEIIKKTLQPLLSPNVDNDIKDIATILLND